MRKTLLILTGALAVAAIALIAVQQARPSPAPPSPAPTPSPLQSPSVQPKITWSPTSSELILSPGESATRMATFTSDQPLQNVKLEPAPGNRRVLDRDAKRLCLGRAGDFSKMERQ